MHLIFEGTLCFLRTNYLTPCFMLYVDLLFGCCIKRNKIQFYWKVNTETSISWALFRKYRNGLFRFKLISLGACSLGHTKHAPCDLISYEEHETRPWSMLLGSVLQVTRSTVNRKQPIPFFLWVIAEFLLFLPQGFALEKQSAFRMEFYETWPGEWQGARGTSQTLRAKPFCPRLSDSVQDPSVRI